MDFRPLKIQPPNKKNDMLVIKILNIGGTKKVANYTYRVLVNLDEIASGTIEDHERTTSWVVLVQKMLDKETEK